MPDEIFQCQYSGCEHQDQSLDSRFCLYHAPRDRKGISPEEFNDRIFRLANAGHMNFEGFVFPFDITFAPHVSQWAKRPNFSRARFLGKVSFAGCVFVSGLGFNRTVFRSHVLDLSSAVFRGDGLEISRCRFVGASINLNGSTIVGRQLRIQNSRIYCTSGVVMKGITIETNEFFLLSISLRKSDVELSGSIKAGRIVFAKLRLVASQFEQHDLDIKSEETEFRECYFGSDYFLFHSSIQSDLTAFSGLEFAGHKASISSCTVEGTLLTFDKVLFHAKVHEIFNLNAQVKQLDFFECRVRNELEILALETGENCRLSFRRPLIESPAENDTVEPFTRILFQKTVFRPFKTVFDGIAVNWGAEDFHPLSGPILAFRMCTLKDVFFQNCNMALFSFYSSAFFEYAHFTNCWWNTQRRSRRFVPKNSHSTRVIEDYLTRQFLRPPIDNRLLFFGLGDLDDFEEVAAIYRKLKDSMDRAKDYHHARWFYYNEQEMKRLSIRNRCAFPIAEVTPTESSISIEASITLPDGTDSRVSEFKTQLLFWSSNWRWLRLVRSLRLWGYTLYKMFAGYGERPLWASLWGAFFLLIFSAVHLLNGIKAPMDRCINYDLDFSLNGISVFFSCAFWRDFAVAVVFSLYRIFPLNYTPIPRDSFQILDTGPWDILLSLTNSLVLVLFVIFIGIGLKRHFRRF